MNLFSGFRRTLISGAFVAATILPGAAWAIPHEGSILGSGNTNLGGILFSSIHRSNTGSVTSANGFSKALSGEISYEWSPPGAPVPGSTQLFDRGPVTVTSFTENGRNYTMQLWTGSSAEGGENSITIGDATGGSVNLASQGLGTVAGRHKAGGQFNFELSELDGNGDVIGTLSDVFVFDIDMQMNSVNKVGIDENGVVATFLWGHTAGFVAGDPFGQGSSASCSADGACANILSDIYGSAGLGIDIAYSGITRVVSEPGALALFGFGLLGLGLARRRKMKL